MENRNMQSMSDDYSRIEKAIHYLDERFPAQPDLAEIAKSVNLSPFHFQRLFRRWAGISPKRFLQFLMLDYAKQALDQSGNVLDATYAAGLSSPSRLHDLFVSVEAVTPGEFKKRGAGLRISYGFHPSPFGECLLAVTDRGICAMYFVTSNRDAVLNEVRRRWPGASFVEDAKATGRLLSQIFPQDRRTGRLPIDLRGTNFQVKVWQALLEIPPGAVVPYRELAARVGNPRASRAVGGAVGQNPIAFIIPCHRVIRKVGAIGGYHGGVNRKRAMLAWEAARTHGEA
ncbi:MAG: methylated-DNA--[protein]-cysteine S-methyltransferase [Acidobacteria bacterium]|nr:MAG: methylated-DNA--[protein]-cysteine S-methyltransferase [Acidobacteriota bacterium]